MDSSSKHILVIEDDPDLGQIFTKKLQINEFQVTLCQDGLQAMLKIQEVKPDMVLLDLLLPHIDGYDILKTLKGNPETSHIPVFIISNLGEDTAKQKGYSIGADKYFIKANTTPSELVQAIKEFFNTNE